MSDAPTPPTRETRVVVDRTTGGATGWVVAAIVAALAIIAIGFMVSSRSPDATQAQIANALEQGRMQGQVEGQSSSGAQAAMNAQIAAERAAAATQQAAADARNSADQAAANVADAAQDASDRIAAEPPQTTQPLTPVQ